MQTRSVAFIILTLSRRAGAVGVGITNNDRTNATLLNTSPVKLYYLPEGRSGVCKEHNTEQQ